MDVKEQIAEVREQIRNCTKCPLSAENNRLRHLVEDCVDERYGKPVPGIGSATAKLMIFGEAPGADEVKQGKPFVGKAGSLLRECLEDIGIDKQMVYIANVIHCRPPGNKFPEDTSIVTACLPWARKQLAILRPLVVVGLGAQPLRHLLRSDDRISAVYGKVFPWHIEAINLDTVYIPSLHPSFCLRPGRSFGPVPTDELTVGQLMMALSVEEKRDILRNNLYLAMKTMQQRMED